MEQIIVINGSGGSGKDTFIDLMRRHPIAIINKSSIDPFKLVAGILGRNGEKTERYRKFLRDLKAISIEYNDYPTQYLLEQIELFRIIKAKNKILFLHIREPEEIEKLKANSPVPVVTVIVHNDNVEQIKSNESDANVYNYHYDYQVTNNGSLEDLEVECDKFINWLMEEGS